MADYLVHKAVELEALSKKLQADIENHTYILSPKYDGCHAIFLFDNGKFVGAKSRTNEPVLSMDHIGTSLLDHYPWISHEGGKVAIMGEAWIPGKEFSEISGIFRRQYPQPELGFVPFDTTVWRYDQAEDGRPVLGEEFSEHDGLLKDKRIYDVRLGRLHFRAWNGPSLVHSTKSWALEKGDAIMATARFKAEHYKKLGGYDGCVLARADGLYQVGAGKGGEFIKIKPLLSFSLQCFNYNVDKGEKTGKNTLSLIVAFNGKAQKVSTGLTQAEIDSPEQFLDKWIEVEAMGLTVNGLLREPRYKGIRTDVI